MDYFAGLDISMDETHVCVVDREGVVVHQSKTASMAGAIAVELAKAPSCRRIVFETGRMATDPVSRVKPTGSSRSLRREPAGLPGAQVARHPQDRSQRRARSGASGSHWFLQARTREVAISSRSPFADHRAQETGRAAGDLGKSDPRFGGRVRDPTASRAHRRLRRSSSQGKRGGCWSLCRHAGSDCGANCRDDGGRSDRRGHETYDQGFGGLQPADDHPRRRPVDCSRLCGRSRRSFAHPPIPRHRRLSGLGPQAALVGRGRLRRQHLEMRRPAGADPPVRSRQRHADPLQGPAQTQGLGLRDRQAINDAQGEGRSGSPPRDHHARDAARRDRVHIGLAPAQSTRQEAETSSQEERRPREGADDGADSVAGANRWPTAIST